MTEQTSDDPTADELLVEWEEVWLRSVTDQIHDLHMRREIHDEFVQMLEAQGHPDRDIFDDIFHRMYVESQAMAIRRQADQNPRTLSLRRLIGQLQEHRKRFTRDWYVGRWVADFDLDSPNERDRHLAKFHIENANAAFDQFTDEPGAQVLGAGRLASDRDDLDAMTEKVVRYVNENIAHAAGEPSAEPVTYAEFHKAIEHLGEMLKRYYLLINQGSLVSPTPTFLRDWKGPFRSAMA